MKDSVARAITRVTTAYRWTRMTGDWKTALNHALHARPLEVHEVAGTPTFYCAIHEDLGHMHHTLDPVHIDGLYLSDDAITADSSRCTVADRACAMAVAPHRVHETLDITRELSREVPGYRPYVQRQRELEMDLHWFCGGWGRPIRVTEIDAVGGILEYRFDSPNAADLSPERMVNLCLGSQDHLGGMVIRTGLHSYDVAVYVRDSFDFDAVRRDERVNDFQDATS